MTHDRIQTPRLMSDPMSVGTQAPSRLEAAAEAPQQQRQQRQQLQELKERAEERARNDLLPVLKRAIAAAEAAERTASERQADAHRMLHQVRLMAEQKAREAAAATADMAAAAEERVAAVEKRAAAAMCRREACLPR